MIRRWSVRQRLGREINLLVSDFKVYYSNVEP